MFLKRFLSQKPIQYTCTLNFNSNFAIFTQDKPEKLPINKYLKKCLKQNNITELTNIQSQSLDVLLEKKNAVITAETGSGKSLCYIIPIMNSILNQKKKFQEISQDVSLPLSAVQRGAVIFAPTKELCAQIYAMIRTIDIENRIKISRTGSIAHIAPIVSFLSDNKVARQKLKQVAFQNVVNSVNWNELDILVSTPTQFEQIMKVKDSVDPFQVNPQTIVIDEMDLLLGESTMSKQTLEILSRYAFPTNKVFGKENLERQFILAGATLPKKIKKTQTVELFDKWFHTPKYIQSMDFHKIPETITFEHLDIEQMLEDNEDYSVFDILVQVVKKSESPKIIVFVEDYKTAEQIADILHENEINAAPFFANMSTENRMQIVNEFHSNQIKVLVSTELASRGHCFEGVDHVIQFDFAKDAVSFLHRVGRTGRLGREGKVTNFIREKDEFFFSKILSLIQNKQSIDQAFSRKRSLKKQSQKYDNDNDSDYE